MKRAWGGVLCDRGSVLHDNGLIVDGAHGGQNTVKVVVFVLDEFSHVVIHPQFLLFPVFIGITQDAVPPTPDPDEQFRKGHAVVHQLHLLFSDELISLYSSDSQVIFYGNERLIIIVGTYFLCGLMEVFSGAIRGLAFSVLSMVISLVGACGFRIIWILTVFQANRSLETLFVSYPVSWALTGLALAISFFMLIHKFSNQLKKEL